MYLGSDAIALAPLTDSITYLEDGDWAVLTRSSATYHDCAGAVVGRRRLSAGSLVIDKGAYRHFMAKEIHEQPEVVGRTLAHYIDMAAAQVRLPFEAPFDWKALDRVVISACGTAYYAGLVGKYWMERFARLPVEIDVASEFRYREAPLPENGLALFVSQSGETADTLAALRYAKDNGQNILSVVNVPTSSIARASDVVAPILAGPEIGVASTKAFTCQLAAMACLAIAAGKARGTLSPDEASTLTRELMAVPGLMAQAMTCESAIKRVARDIAKMKNALYLGRGTNYPLALEGSLKLKEISYIHAEAYAAGKLKHGPIVLIDEAMPVIIIAPSDGIYEKTVSNMQEVAARGGRIILVSDQKGVDASGIADQRSIVMPAMGSTFTPIVYAVAVQFLAYHAALALGKDVDQPRNLAKSVTVE